MADSNMLEIIRGIAQAAANANAIPGLTVILVGDDPASKIYVKNKGYIAIYQERARHRARKYMISHRGKLLITRFYKILEKKEDKI